MTEASKLAAKIADGILVEGSPFREILVRAALMKRASEQLAETAVPCDDGFVVSREALDALRDAVSQWSEPLN
jgi:hypothetical protein